MKNNDPSSFRDPSGFIFIKNFQVYRQINKVYLEDFDSFIKSGLYKTLFDQKFIISHKIVVKQKDRIILKHEKIPFISYPYEWSFSQLKDAALLTLSIQKTALDHNMSLKDASAYNIQFVGARPILIDTLSFEKYKENSLWIAYKQFCQHFLAPLALMSYKDFRLSLLSRDFIDGIPLDLAAKLLPAKTKLNFSILSHIHLHSLAQKNQADKKLNKKKLKISKAQLIALITNLENAISGLKMSNEKTQWESYYTFTNYSRKSFGQKHKLVEKFIKLTKSKSVLDLGANNAEFSKIATSLGAYSVACDIDPLAVESAYLNAKKNNNKNLLPLVVDLTNPSPAIGWANQERMDFSSRCEFDTVLALALVHHLAISNNLPFDMIAKYFSSLGKYLIIEFVPKDDSKVQILLQNREDIFSSYNKTEFENAFSPYYKVVKSEKITGSKRTLYLMRKK
jgi:ribosomal protein L11 methylase PrmA